MLRRPHVLLATYHGCHPGRDDVTNAWMAQTVHRTIISIIEIYLWCVFYLWTASTEDRWPEQRLGAEGMQQVARTWSTYANLDLQRREENKELNKHDCKILILFLIKHENGEILRAHRTRYKSFPITLFKIYFAFLSALRNGDTFRPRQKSFVLGI